jgi:hypothetical protein
MQHKTNLIILYCTARDCTSILEPLPATFTCTWPTSPTHRLQNLYREMLQPRVQQNLDTQETLHWCMASQVLYCAVCTEHQQPKNIEQLLRSTMSNLAHLPRLNLLCRCKKINLWHSPKDYSRTCLGFGAAQSAAYFPLHAPCLNITIYSPLENSISPLEVHSMSP